MKLFGFDSVVLAFILNEEVLPYLIIDNYGNYIAQSALSLCDQNQQDIFIQVKT